MSTESTPTVPNETQPKLKAKSRHNGHPALGWMMNFLARLPLLLQLPVYLVVFLLVSPPAVLNLWACSRAMRQKHGRLRVLNGPEFIFFYPLIAWGYVFSTVSSFGVVPEPVLSWLYVALFLFTAITVGLDFKSSGWFGLGVLLIAALCGLGWWASVNNVPVLGLLGNVTTWFHLDVFPRAMVFALSTGLLIVYLAVLVHMNLYNVLQVRGNYVEVKNFLGNSEKNTRASYGIVPGTDDVNELILGWSIPIHLKAKTSRIASHRFENVPAGFVVEDVLTALLNAQEVATADDWMDDGDDGEDDDS